MNAPLSVRSKPVIKPKSAIIGQLLAVVCLPMLAVLAALQSEACGNPAIDVQVDALPAEVAGVPQGEYHRPGQPCVDCHSVYGGAQEFTVGGTIFADTTSFLPVSGAQVFLTDSVGSQHEATTNCVGNFYIPKASWNAQFPLAAEVHYPVYDADGKPEMMPDPTDSKEKVQVYKVKAMGSWISRNGSCAFCHTMGGRQPTKDSGGNIVDYGSSGWIYCNAPASSTSPADTNPFPKFDKSTCPGVEPAGPVPKELSADGSEATTAGAGGAAGAGGGT